MDTRCYWSAYGPSRARLPQGLGARADDHPTTANAGLLHLEVVTGRRLLRVLDLPRVLLRIQETTRSHRALADQGVTEG